MLRPPTPASAPRPACRGVMLSARHIFGLAARRPATVTLRAALGKTLKPTGQNVPGRGNGTGRGPPGRKEPRRTQVGAREAEVRDRSGGEEHFMTKLHIMKPAGNGAQAGARDAGNVWIAVGRRLALRRAELGYGAERV